MQNIMVTPGRKRIRNITERYFGSDNFMAGMTIIHSRPFGVWEIFSSDEVLKFELDSSG